MTHIGYARVSTAEQNTEAQERALTEAGCDTIYTDQGVSGAKTSRPGLDGALAALQPGDTLVIWKLDRLGRSLKHLLSIVEGLAEQGVNFQSLTDGFDTSTAGGKMVFSVMGAMAEYERNLIRERTLEGLKTAKLKGRTGGKPKTDAGIFELIEFKLSNGATVKDACAASGISRNTWYEYLKVKDTAALMATGAA